MSWQMVDRVLQFSHTSGCERLLLVCIAHLADDDGICRYGWRKIADAAGYKRSRYYEVLRAISWPHAAALEALGEEWPPEKIAARGAVLGREIIVAQQTSDKGVSLPSWLYIAPYVDEPPRVRRKRTRTYHHATRQDSSSRPEAMRSRKRAAPVTAVG